MLSIFLLVFLQPADEWCDELLLAFHRAGVVSCFYPASGAGVILNYWL
jgi:hypothetical protein